MRVGIFGGTFDPPHLGHLVIAQEALHRLRLDRLLVIPAAVPPHKRDAAITDGRLRLEMVRAAFGDLPGAVSSDLELRRGGTSYTVDTLREIGALHPGAELFLILGADQVRELESWREPAAIRGLAGLAVFRRADVDPGLPVSDVGKGVVELRIPRLDISSTEIRRRVRYGEPVRFLAPEPVLQIIRREKLYGG